MPPKNFDLPVAMGGPVGTQGAGSGVRVPACPLSRFDYRIVFSSKPEGEFIELQAIFPRPNLEGSGETTGGHHKRDRRLAASAGQAELREVNPLPDRIAGRARTLHHVGGSGVARRAQAIDRNSVGIGGRGLGATYVKS